MPNLKGYVIKERYSDGPKIQNNSFYEEPRYDRKSSLQDVRHDIKSDTKSEQTK